MPADLHTLRESCAKLSPPLIALLRLKALMGPFCRGALPEALNLAEIRPGRAARWTASLLAAQQNTLAVLELLDTTGDCVLPLRHELACTAASDPLLLEAVRLASNLPGVTERAGPYAHLALRLRLATYTNDATAFLAAKAEADVLASPRHPFAEQFLHDTLEMDWFLQRAMPIQAAILRNRVRLLLQESQVSPGLDGLCSLFFRQPAVFLAQGDAAPLLTLLLFANRLAEAEQGLATLSDRIEAESLRGMIHFFRGQDAEALSAFAAAFKVLRKDKQQRHHFLPSPAGLVWLLTLLRAKHLPDQQAQLTRWMNAAQDNPDLRLASRAILVLNLLCDGHKLRDITILLPQTLLGTRLDPLCLTFLCLAEIRLLPTQAAAHAPTYLARVRDWGQILPLLGCQLVGPLRKLAGRDALSQTLVDELTEVSSARLLPSLLDADLPEWKQRLELLRNMLCRQTDDAPVRDKERRLCWLYDPDACRLVPIEQVRKANGQWSAGRQISLSRLCSHANASEWLTPEDTRVLSKVSVNRNWGSTEYTLDIDEALPALVGHPRIFHADTRAPLRFTSVQTELRVCPLPRGAYELKLHPAPAASGPLIADLGDGEFGVTSNAHEVVTLRGFLGEQLRIPAEGADMVRQLLVEGSSLPVRLDDHQQSQGHPPVTEGSASSTPVIQLKPNGSGLDLRVVVRPFALPKSPVFRPGQGNAAPLTPLDTGLLRVRRDFSAEMEAVGALCAACPSLEDQTPPDLVAEGLHLADPEAALNLLKELRVCPDIQVEWPEGERLRLLLGPDGTPFSASSLNLGLKQAPHGESAQGGGLNWFELRGAVHVDAQRVVELSQVLERIDEAKGGYLPLGDGEFLALTRDLARQLRKLQRLSERGAAKPGEGCRIHALSSEALAPLLDGAAELRTDAAWEDWSTRWREVQALNPVLPSTLHADLRDYQIEGFVWLSRLVRLGVGACLADDMGLGKTLQTLAVLLEQALHGPCLVVAPTSVCHNWELEAARFAPTLRVVRLGSETSSVRRQRLAELEAGDLLIVSYGLLLSEAKNLAARPWRMVVFDEAQALKNAETKRAKAARSLGAHARLVLTGTPIENRLDDLWSLFQILNPGLLGSQKSFRARFTLPIAQGDAEARNSLKALVRPFILRRMKSQVLTELPPRTEQTLLVDLPPEERALYEALRQRALDTISQLNGPQGQRRVHILAELTRLRRACCHPALIDPQTPLPGAKLEVFMELVREIIGSGHKALVFSQFVGHLALVRNALTAAGIAFQYLDGATPEPERRASVAAFQAGERDLFLISLRAGGQGLNLTAADYVIHLDPWWNPAVEDQATDRAHRMGQQRPVTVYRLVTENSVEEKILALHHSKRDLAADFLEGADSAAPLSEQDLLALLGL